MPARPRSVSLALSAFAANGQPIEVQLPAIRLVAGETLHVAPTNWRKLGSAPVRISATVHGRTSIRLLRGSGVGKVFASVRSAALTRGRRPPLPARSRPPCAPRTQAGRVVGGGQCAAPRAPGRAGKREPAQRIVAPRRQHSLDAADGVRAGPLHRRPAPP